MTADELELSDVIERRFTKGTDALTTDELRLYTDFVFRCLAKEMDVDAQRINGSEQESVKVLILG